MTDGQGPQNEWIVRLHMLYGEVDGYKLPPLQAGPAQELDYGSIRHN